jgi:hypothetical protein
MSAQQDALFSFLYDRADEDLEDLPQPVVVFRQTLFGNLAVAGYRPPFNIISEDVQELCELLARLDPLHQGYQRVNAGIRAHLNIQEVFLVEYFAHIHLHDLLRDGGVIPPAPVLEQSRMRQ